MRTREDRAENVASLVIWGTVLLTMLLIGSQVLRFVARVEIPAVTTIEGY